MLRDKLEKKKKKKHFARLYTGVSPREFHH